MLGLFSSSKGITDSNGQTSIYIHETPDWFSLECIVSTERLYFEVRWKRAMVSGTHHAPAAVQTFVRYSTANPCRVLIVTYALAFMAVLALGIAYSLGAWAPNLDMLTTDLTISGDPIGDLPRRLSAAMRATHGLGELGVIAPNSSDGSTPASYMKLLLTARADDGRDLLRDAAALERIAALSAELVVRVQASVRVRAADLAIGGYLSVSRLFTAPDALTPAFVNVSCRVGHETCEISPVPAFLGDRLSLLASDAAGMLGEEHAACKVGPELRKGVMHGEGCGPVPCGDGWLRAAPHYYTTTILLYYYTTLRCYYTASCACCDSWLKVEPTYYTTLLYYYTAILCEYTSTLLYPSA